MIGNSENIYRMKETRGKERRGKEETEIKKSISVEINFSPYVRYRQYSTHLRTPHKFVQMRTFLNLQGSNREFRFSVLWVH
jgi:hypothetical protein